MKLDYSFHKTKAVHQLMDRMKAKRYIHEHNFWKFYSKSEKNWMQFKVEKQARLSQLVGVDHSTVLALPSVHIRQIQYVKL